MNDCCPPIPLPATRPELVERAAPAFPAKTSAPRGFFASLERLINTASFVSVDLTDTLFASLPPRDSAPPAAVVRPNCSE